MPADETMDDAFYAESEDNETPETPEAEKSESVDQEEQENPTALIPLSKLGGNVKEGDSVTLKVVKLYGDEAEVEISGSEKPMMGGPETESAESEFRKMEMEG